MMALFLTVPGFMGLLLTVAGVGQMIPGFDSAVIGMEAGETKTVMYSS
ncbi:MAG: FKBP-type peptidyl-prolyl cis-trans isomerase [Methanolobus sp.]